MSASSRSKQYSPPSDLAPFPEASLSAPLAIRYFQLKQLGECLPSGLALMLGCWVTLGSFIAFKTTPQALAAILIPGILMTSAFSLFHAMLRNRLDPSSAHLSQHVTWLSHSYHALILSLAVIGGFGVAFYCEPLSLADVRELMPFLFVAVTLLSLWMATWTLALLGLMSIPVLWAFTVLSLHPEFISGELVMSLALLTLMHGSIAILGYRRLREERQQQLELAGRIRDQEVLYHATAQRCTQLTEENRLAGQREKHVRHALRQLEHTLADKTTQIAELNAELGQQGALRKSISRALVKSQSRLSQAIEAAELSLWDWDIEHNTIYQSFFHKAFGLKEMSTADFVRQMHAMIPEEHLRQIRLTMIRCLKGYTTFYRVQYPVKLPDQDEIWIEDRGKPVAFNQTTGRVTRMLGTRRDITEERKRNEALLLAKSFFDTTSEGIFALDAQFRFLTANRAFSRLTGCSLDEILGQPILEVSHTPQKRQVARRIQESLNNSGAWEGELYEKRVGGDYFIASLQLKAISDEDGNITHYTGLFGDMTDKKVTDDKLHYLLNYDDLTGLANRVLFRDRLHKLLNRLRDEEGGGIALILIDIDRFRQVNEGLGHDLGDELLKQMALRISRASQDAESVARLGSDEFTVLLSFAQEDIVKVYCDRLLDDLKVPFLINGQELFVAVSLGVTLAPRNGREIQLLMQQVNIAVRQAKYVGGSTVEFYSRRLQSLTSQRLDVETELRRGLQKDQLDVYYQPQFSLKTGRIVGAEALVRWDHPERGLISPVDFIPVAEESGLIAAIGETVLLRACRQSAEWRQAGLGDIRVSVNVSAYQLRQDTLVELVERTLRDSELPASLLDLELTESALMENLSRTRYTLGRLRENGIQITIDDFGTGYSSLAYLKRFPINALKVDRVFVKDAPDNPGDASIIRAIVSLGKSLEMEVIAEGVETEQQLAFLREQSCDLIQGYLISHPVKPQQFKHLLEAQQNEPESSISE